MKVYNISYIALFFVCVLTLSQNCAKNSFSQSTARQPTSVQGVVNIQDVDDTILDEVQANCTSARQAGTLFQAQQQIEFANTREETGRAHICDFGINDNLPTANTFMQARYEQKQKLQLPENAVICDVDMNTNLQRFIYDDIFVFSYNNFILATNNKSALLSTTAPETTLLIDAGEGVDVYKYNWLKLRGASFRNVADDFCLGGDQNLAQCSWPITEQPGNIVMSFDQKLLIALGLTANSSNQTFSFVITGDNDLELDCFHEKLAFNMKVSYYIKNK